MTFAIEIILALATAALGFEWFRERRRRRAAEQATEAMRERVARHTSDSAIFDTRIAELASRNEAILRTSMDGFFVVDSEHCFLEVNHAFCRMTGYSEAQLLRMKIVDLEVDETHRRANSDEFARTGMHHFPVAHLHRDGHTIHLEISIIVLRDRGRKIVVGFARDITERRRADDALIQVSRQKKLILNSVAEGICGLDNDGRISFANPAAARMLGRSPGELVGREAGDIFHLKPHLLRGATLIHGVDGPIRSTAEAVFRRGDGASFDAEYSVAPMHDNAEQIGSVIVFEDVTPRKRAEEDRRKLEQQMQTAQKLESLGLLAGGIAHDFNNILVGILGNACLAQEELAESSPARQRLSRIVSAGQRASKIIHQILAYAGRSRTDPNPVNLNRAIEETVEFMRPSIAPRVDLRCELDEDLPLIEADSGQLEQILTNLLLNSVEAIGELAAEAGSEAASQAVGKVTFATAGTYLSETAAEVSFPGQGLKPGSYVSLSVRDSGCGMSAATLERIFEPFYTRKPRGRGLGLAAIRGIVRGHSGGIRVESTLGVGTTFTIVLPALNAPQPAIPTGSESLPPAGAAGTILVIDDEEDIREVVQSILSGRGLGVITAHDGRSGVETFRRESDHIDAVLLDLTMPGMDGAEVYQALRAIRPDVQVILSSGFSESDAIARLGDAPIARFVHKPYTLAALLDAVNGALVRDRVVEAAS